MASGLRTDDPGSGTDTHRHRSMHSSSSGTGNEISNCHRNRSGDLAIVGKGNGKGREEGGNRDRGEVKEEGAEYSQVHGNDLKLPLVIPSDHLPTHFIPYPDFNQPSSSTAPSSETHHILPGGSIILKRGMACTFCRRRKLRCSGEKPKCANCARYHQDCEYLTRKEPPEIEVEITDSPVVYPSPFTAVPLPTDRGPAPPQPERRSWRRASIQRPFDFEPWSRRNSIQRDDHFTPGRGPDDLWGSRPGLGGIRSAPTRRVSPLTPQVGLPSVDDTSTTPQQGSSTSTAAGTSAGSWAHQEAPSMPRHDSGSAPLISPPIAQHQSSPTIPTPVHYEGVPMTQPQPTPPLPIPVHYERITPIPPPVQYPAVNETAWYQAALNLDPQQMFGETYHPPVQQSQQQEHYPPPPPAPEPHYPAYEGYRDISSTFDSSANVGPNPLPLSASIAPPGSSMSYPPPPPHVYHGPGPGPMAMSHGSSMGGYDMPGPSPYASQVNLPLHSAPVTMPIYGHNPYSTPEIDGYRPGLVHEGMYPPAPSSGGFGGYDPNSRVFQESHSMVPAPSSTQFHPPPSMDGFPLHGNQIQNTTPYTFPAMSIPLPEDTTYFDRPPIPRAVSNPTNLNAVSENTTPSHSDGSVSQAPTTTTVNVSVPEGEYYPQNMNVMYPDESGPSKIDKLSERLGEFFLGPEKKEMNGAAGNEDQGQRAGAERHIKKSRKSVSGAGGVGMSYSPSHESDGLSETARNALLDTFFEHHKMFIDLSIPRFKSRLTFHDRRRPSLALLNAMYMWATRMSHPPNMSTMETHFYQQAIVHLDASAATGDRLMDCIRAAFLLSAFQYMNGRHHSGYLLCGHSAQLVKSCGLHRIESTVFTPAPPINPFLRNRPYLLPPPEDALELGERIHTFWAVFSLDRSSSALTGFTSSFRDSDVTTPWPRELSDIASGNVTTRDDVTVRDLYRHAYQHPNERSYLRWIKAVTILERASKLVLIDPEDSSEHTNQWTYHLSNPGSPTPPGYLESPRYRVPTEFEEVKYALEHLIAACGDEGVYPVEQKKEAVKYGKEEVVISPAVILFHHVVAAIQTLLYDTNSLDAENTEALVGARKAVELIKELPPLPVHAVDAFAPLTWVMVAKVLIKEMYRLKRLGDQRHRLVEEEVQCLIDEINRVGLMMPPSKMYAKGVEDLLKYGNLQAEPSFTNTTTNGHTTMTNSTGMNQYPQHY